MITLAWLVQSDAPIDLLFAELEKMTGSDDQTKNNILLGLEAKGWIKLFGASKGEPGDVLAVLQEHFEIKSNLTKGKRGSDGPKKRLE